MQPVKFGIIRKLVSMAVGALLVCTATSINAQDLQTLARSVAGRHAPPMRQEDYARAEAELARYFQNQSPESISNTGWSGLQNQIQAGTTQPGNDFFSETVASGQNQGNGDSGGGVDPSDPTQTVFHVMYEWEWQSLSDQDGELMAFKVSPFIPFQLAKQKFLFNFEVPLPQHADLTGLGGFSGIGDTRLKLFWLIPTNSKKVRAIVPSMDAIAPTGDETRGLGGGQWIWIPNVVFALQPAENLSIYPIFRYIHADGVAPDLVTELPGLPEVPGDVFATTDIRGLGIEAPIVFGLENAVMDWISVTPDYFQSVTGDREATLTMKYDSGIKLTDQWFLIGEAWHPVSSRTGNDFTFKLKLDWYPKTRNCGRCHGFCRCRR